VKAVVYHKPKDIRVEDVPDPRIIAPTDAIVRVSATAICGSDLHIYNGLVPQTRPMVMGHEFTGVVEEVGREVNRVRIGDRVIVPFAISCGTCWFCDRQLPNQCQQSNPGRYGPDGGLLKEKGGGIFGYTDLYGGYDGGQAEAVRVPWADVNCFSVPMELTDEQVLFLTDIIPTGWAGIDWADLRGGETVAVYGCGPVGLMAMKAAWVKGARRVIGVDIEGYRVETAMRVADADGIDATTVDPVMAIRDLTEGRGADVVVDAVGMEASESLLRRAAHMLRAEAGSISVMKQAFRSVRRGGAVSVLGTYASNYDGFPVGQIFDKQIRVRSGRAPVHVYLDRLMNLVSNHRLRADDIVTHRLPFADAPRAYKIFNDKDERCVKVVLRPHG
jgi:threonine dehydrogenase-like Zn-dependent dehydrogenase